MYMYLEFDIFKKLYNEKGGNKTQLCFPENP